jgi:hypothetical protein
MRPWQLSCAGRPLPATKYLDHADVAHFAKSFNAALFPHTPRLLKAQDRSENTWLVSADRAKF